MGQYIIIAIVIGLVIGLIYTGILKSSLKSIKTQETAVFYQKEAGLQLTRRNDIYIRKTLDKVAKPKEQKK